MIQKMLIKVDLITHLHALWADNVKGHTTNIKYIDWYHKHKKKQDIWTCHSL